VKLSAADGRLRTGYIDPQGECSYADQISAMLTIASAKACGAS
jgi:hypothetical protein